MPARTTPLVTGQFYHIFNRGVNKQPIFLNRKDYARALSVFEFYSFVDIPIRFSKFLLLSLEERFKILKDLRKRSLKYVDFISYCFMPNHFHFLVKQNRDNGISKFMGDFQNSYTKYFNTKHERIGPILQGQFKAVFVEDENQLLHLSRYIHLNPFTSFVVKDLTDLDTYK
ncbi:transposase [Candidatus Microgenomates bacterium]|nr:transposase [Candidatus Microgenomates bacterium]